MRAVPHSLPEILETVEENGFPWALDCVFETFNSLMEIDPEQSWKRILHDASEIIVDFLGADAATIRLQEPYLNRMISFGSYQFAEELREEAIGLDDTIAGKVVSLGISQTVSDIQECTEYHNKEAVRHRYRSLLAVPLVIERYLEEGDNVMGAIQIYFAGGPREFTKLEIKIAEILAQRVSYVLARKRIIDMKRVNEKKEWLVGKLFSKISLEKGIKMKELFGLMVEELGDIIRIQSCSLFTISDDGKQALLETGYPDEGSYHTIGKVFDLAEHPYLLTAVMGDRPLGDFQNERIYPSYLLIKNPIASSLTTDDLREFSLAHDINSILYIPLRIDDRVRHLLVFDALEKRRFFSDEDIEILTFFGKELTQALEIERLDDILHDFKNPAIAIAGFARRVRKMIVSNASETDQMLKFVDVVIQEGMRLQEMAMSLYPIARPESVDLAEVATQRFLINREAISEQRLGHIELEIDEMPEGIMVLVPRLALERVMDNLLTNATRAIPQSGGYLSIGASSDGERAILEISNTGRIPEEAVEKIRSADDKGRGLNIVHRFVSMMGGRVEVEAGLDQTTFRIILPLDKS